MDHTHIVTAGDLDRFSETRLSESLIPELIYQLVRLSVPAATICRIPYGDAVNQPGMDGRVETEVGFPPYVPSGSSCWEIGTGADPQDKATRDFRRRTSELGESERNETAFVFVTPRSAAQGGWNESKQAKWLRRRKDKGWRQIIILDGVKLADWLREFPAIGRWMARKVEIMNTPVGLSSPRDHWDTLLANTQTSDPPLPPVLFITGREDACAALQELFANHSHRLVLFAESQDDVFDFVAGYVASLESESSTLCSNRCLFVADEAAWLSVVQSRPAHVLVADPRLGLDSERTRLAGLATNRGHSVVIPLCGAWSEWNPEIVKLRSPGRYEIETTLRKAGFSDQRSRELGHLGGGRLSALVRKMQGFGAVPPYARWGTARRLAQLALCGGWDGSNEEDRAVLEDLLGKGYGEWIESLRADSMRSDSPLHQHEEKWRFLARGECWTGLGPQLTNEDLEQFQDIAVRVLGERHPMFDLQEKDRFAASVHGKQLKYSKLLRSGIAETLALLGSRPQGLSSCSYGKPDATAILVVRELLSEAPWDRWASLGSLLPLIAEAAPSEFLDCVEAALVAPEESPFRQVFAEEGAASLGGINHMVGLLWALELLAWSPDHLSRAAVALANLAAIDPGGKWSNRPSNSLASILLPWYPQTAADVRARLAAMTSVLLEQPEIGWRLLLSLLPLSHGTALENYRPVWRQFIPDDWEPTTSEAAYAEQITAIAELVIESAQNSTRLAQLVKRLPDLPRVAFKEVLGQITSPEFLDQPEDELVDLWEELNDLARNHRANADAAWSLPEHAVLEIEAATKVISPKSPSLAYRHLFRPRDLIYFKGKEEYEDARQRLLVKQDLAAKQLCQSGDIGAVLEFVETIGAPEKFGRALARLSDKEVSESLLPVYLETESDSVRKAVAAFVRGRHWDSGWTWADAMLGREWTQKEKARFLALLPFGEEVWERASRHLSGEAESLFWRIADVSPWGYEGDMRSATERLIEVGRHSAAIVCIAESARKDQWFAPELAIRALRGVLRSETSQKKLDQDAVLEVISKLQATKIADEDSVATIEWSFMPWLDRFSKASPVILEKRLSTDPKFFSELISLVFRPRNKSSSSDSANSASKAMVENAYRLLTEWRRCPGTNKEGEVDGEALRRWIAKARELTTESGRGEVAEIQIGRLLSYAPADPDGLWIHEDVARELNSKDVEKMRSGFSMELRNQRGVFHPSGGKEESDLALAYREKADALEQRGLSRIANEVRGVAVVYEHDAEREASRRPEEWLKP